jgi:membrane protease YdiL (CAAX protease family)
MKEKSMNFLLWKKDIITGLVVLAAFLFFVFTREVPALGGIVQGFILMLIFFGFLPLGYHFLVLRKSKEEIALTIKNSRQGITLALIASVSVFLLSILLLQISPGFWGEYNLPLSVKESFGFFLLYELLLVPVVIIFFEIFFRGFIQYSWLQTRLGTWAIFIQGGLFLIFLLATKSLSWSTVPLALFSFVSGFLMQKTHSLLYPFLATWLYILLMDVYFLVTV